MKTDFSILASWHSLSETNARKRTYIPKFLVGVITHPCLNFISDPFYWHGLTLIPACINNYILIKCSMKLLIHPINWVSKFIWLKVIKRNKKCLLNVNKANLRDLIAATGLVILLKLDSNRQFFTRVTLKFDGWPRKLIRHVFYKTSSFVYHFISISEFKLELQSGNAQFGSN